MKILSCYIERCRNLDYIVSILNIIYLGIIRAVFVKFSLTKLHYKGH